MKVGRMYRVAGISDLKLNDCMMISPYYNAATSDPVMETGQSMHYNDNRPKYRDGAVMVCVGKVERATAHYEPQPFYRVLTLDGKTALISQATRKYFKPLKSKLCERERPEECP